MATVNDRSKGGDPMAEALVPEPEHLEQKLQVMEQIQKKTLEYLDRFKAELKNAKQELTREKSSLNTALKQVQMLGQERDRMKKELAATRKLFQQEMDGVTSLLSVLVRKRVETNRNHGERVAHVASFVAKELGVDEKRLEDLRKAAMLHEIGLLFMPEPGKDSGGQGHEFSAYERDILAQYPVKGAELIGRCQSLEPVAKIIRSLNENSDGTGHPERLRKRYIPLLSRILAGADVFDRLRDDPGITGLKEFLAALEGVSGSRLDPVIVGRLEKYAVLHMGSGTEKVRGVGVEQLEPGMRLGTALFTATGTKLFSADTRLTRDAIDKIIQYNRAYPVDDIILVKV